MDQYISSKNNVEDFLVTGHNGDYFGAAKDILKNFNAKMGSLSKSKNKKSKSKEAVGSMDKLH